MKKALKDLKPEDNDLQLVFLKAIDQSRKVRMVLGREIQTLGEDIPTGTSESGGAIHPGLAGGESYLYRS